MITERQGKILDALIKEYIDRAEPVGSELLKKKCGLSVSPATIRNELQDLTEKGYITQLHTSSGRVPTDKGYRYFIEITFSGKTEIFPEFIIKEIEEAKQKIEKELELARELEKTLFQISSMLELKIIEEDVIFEVLKVMGPSKNNYKKNISLMEKLLEEFENF